MLIRIKLNLFINIYKELNFKRKYFIKKKRSLKKNLRKFHFKKKKKMLRQDDLIFYFSIMYYKIISIEKWITKAQFSYKWVVFFFILKKIFSEGQSKNFKTGKRNSRVLEGNCFIIKALRIKSETNKFFIAVQNLTGIICYQCVM